jgi:subtilase family serine protease
MKRALVLTGALALASCAAGGNTPGVTQALLPSVQQSAPRAPLAESTFDYGAKAVAGASYVGPATEATTSVDVALKLRNAAGLIAYAAAVSNPQSAEYRRFLTPEQIGSMYGATVADVRTVARYFGSYHLRVGAWPQRLSLVVSGPQDALARAFGTKLGIYQSGSQQFVAPVSTPHFSRALPVTAVTRLVTLTRSFRTTVPLVGNAVTTSGYLPQQVRNVFDYTGAYNAGFNGRGITIGVVGTGPISSADVPAYGSMFDTRVARVAERYVTDQAIASVGIENPPDTGFKTPPRTTANCDGYLPRCNPEDTEAQIDTEQIAGLAPASTVRFYLGYDPSYCETASGSILNGPCGQGQQPLEGLPVSDDEIQQVIADNAVDVLSLSYGGPEAGAAGYEFSATNPDQGIGPEEFAALTAEGVAVFVSSGDTGAQGCARIPADANDPCVSYPATDPSVTSVGGVTVPLDTFGNLTGPIIGWGLTTTQGSGGSGGGFSAYFPRSLTPWQVGPHIRGANRNQPDVSLLGDPETGVATLLYAKLGGPDVGGVGGTSVAAPEMAAMWGLVLQACKQSSACATAQGSKPYRLGNAAPLLYGLYSNGHGILPTYKQTFYDVIYGDNQTAPTDPSPSAPPLDPGYKAGPGYDRVTGLGVPFARALIKAVTKQ